MKAIGLLGGTFDPVHCGHLDAARAAREALGLHQVWLTPSRHPPHRGGPIASPAHRFAMVALALNGVDWLRACDVEMERPGPSFTIDTLDALEARYPKLRGGFVFITGIDAFREIATWRRWEDLLDRCHFAVVSRRSRPTSEVRQLLPQLANRVHEAPCALTPQPGVFLIDAPTADVSSTTLRADLAAGRSVASFLPDAVAEYALRHGLYADSTPLEAPSE